MTAHGGCAAFPGGVVLKPPRNEPAGEVRGRRSALSYGDLGDAEGVWGDRNALVGEQWRAWWEAEAGVDGWGSHRAWPSQVHFDAGTAHLGECHRNRSSTRAEGD